VGLIESDDLLAVALSDVAALGTDRDRDQVAAIGDRLRSARLRVLVAGAAKRGKSTLVNAFLGQPVLPVGVTPLTAVATTVRYGDNPHAEVRFADGHEERHPYAALDDLVTERGNPANRRGIASVTVYVDAPILADGVELVDTPGTGSVFAWNTEAAHDALETMDAAVFVLTADPPVSASEQDLLRKVAELSVRTFVVLNKADYLDEAGLAEAVGFTQQVLREVPGPADGAGASGAVYPMSARAALTPAGDPGFAAFAADFAAYLKTSRLSDLRLSAAGQARRIAVSLQDEVALTRRAAQMRAGDAAQRVEEFSARLAEVTIHSRDAVAVVGAESGRLLFALNDAADQALRRLREDFGRRLDELLGGELRGASPADIERKGHERLAALVLDSVSTWRDERREQIEQGLARVDARLAGDLKAELDVLRGSAAELLDLDLDLAVPEPGGWLAEDRAFFFSTGEDAGQTELLAGAIRRSLPGRAGRRRAGAYLRRTAADLVGSQVGRARADLQYRLAEATRVLVRVVEQRHTDGTERMSAALRTAADLRQASGAEAGRKETALTEREEALRRVLGLLDQVVA
jgi:GTP-binding protein EngB required for normal cell division